MTTSDELFNAVSNESCTTPIINPMPTTCMAMSFEILKNEQARGISIREPPAIPDVPQAQMTETMHIKKDVPKLTSIPRVFTAAMVMITMVTAAPDMLMVQPKGIEMEYDSLGIRSFSQRARLTGIFAAEDLVKNAVIPEFRTEVITSGYGFLKV